MVIVLDCNIWISLIINKQIDFITEIAEYPFEIASCQELKQELIEVLSRPKLSKFIGKNIVNVVSQFHDMITKLHTIDEILDVVSDKKDNYLFALCLEAKANYFVTGDKLLINESVYQETKIISLKALKDLMKNA